MFSKSEKFFNKNRKSVSFIIKKIFYFGLFGSIFPVGSVMKKILKEIIPKSPKDVPVLNITIANKPIATLFYDKDKKSYGLIYHEEYKDYEGLHPFNIDLSRNESVKIGEPYYSAELWYPFSARIPSKNRRDCIEKLKEHNLTLDDHPLKILGCIGRVSIANLWKLEPVRLPTHL